MPVRYTEKRLGRNDLPPGKGQGIPAHDLSEYQRLKAFLRQYEQFTESQIRWLLRFRDENGLSAHTLKVGREIYIHVPGFLRWLDEQRLAA